MLPGADGRYVVGGAERPDGGRTASLRRGEAGLELQPEALTMVSGPDGRYVPG